MRRVAGRVAWGEGGRQEARSRGVPVAGPDDGAGGEELVLEAHPDEG